MGIKAIVFDIGGVLEINPAMDFGSRWEAKLGLPAGATGSRLADVWAAGAIGTMTEALVLQAIGERLGLTVGQVDAMMADMWAEYLGVANTELIEYARALRPRFRTGIVSNSFVGAREREQAAYGFEDLVDEIVYSHEVGMSKPDPRIYQLICTRLAVQPDEVIFLDDNEPMVAGARDVGMHGVRYRNPAQAIAAIEAALPVGAVDRGDHRPQ